MRRSRRIIALLTASLAASALGVAGRASTEISAGDFTSLDLEQLMQVSVVTATRRAADPFELPFLAQTIDLSVPPLAQPRTLPGTLEQLPGVSVQKTSRAQQSPYLRGFTGFRTLLLIDGVRLNNSVFREGPNQYWATLDLLSLDHLELVSGPASVLYGSGAIGGTLQAFTPQTDWSVLQSWSRTAMLRLSSAEHSVIGRLATQGPVGQTGRLQLGVSLKDFGDYRTASSSPRQPRTGYAEQALDAKYEHRLSSHLTLTALHQNFSQDDAWRTHSTIYGTSWQGTVPGTDRQRSFDQARQLSYVRLDAHDLRGLLEEAQVIISHHRQVELAHRIRANGRSEHSRVAVNTYGVQANFHASTRLGRWTSGFSTYQDLVSSAAQRYAATGAFERSDIQGPVGDDASYRIAGLYLQNELPALGPLALTARLRHDRHDVSIGRYLDTETNAPASFSDHYTATVGGLHAALALPSPDGVGLRTFAGISQAFRAPNLSDLTRLDTVSSNRIETSAPSLSPEHYVIREIGLKARTDRLQITATFFDTDIDGMIIRRPTGRVIFGLVELSKLNSGDGYLHGAEFEGQFALTPRLTLRVASTWLEGRILSFPSDDPSVATLEPLSRLAPLTTHVALRWQIPAHRLALELATSTARRQTHLAEADRADVERIPPGGTPGYSTVHLHARWQATAHLTLSISLQNLMDADYRIHGSGENEPGRNVLLAAQIRL